MATGNMLFGYAPFVTEYWPVVVAGLVCFVAAKFIYQASAFLQGKEERDNKQNEAANGDLAMRKYSYRTPDEGT